MNIDRTPGDFRTSSQDEPSGAWGKFKHWSGEHPRLSRVLWFAVGIVLLVLLVWAIYPKPQGRGPGGARFGQQTAQPVGVAKAVLGDIDITLNALGTVTPLATATVRPQVSGVLMKINFTEGQMVKAGDVLAEIDPRTYQATLDQARGQLARDQATLANTKTDLARYEQLSAQNAISQQQLSTQQALVRSQSGTLTSDEANVENARINLGYTRIVSPITGRVGLHLVDVGNIVSNGQATGIVVVTQLDPISVLFTVPEDNVAAILARVHGGATLPVDILDRGQTKKLATGNLATVDNVIDPTTGSVKLRALFDNKDGSLFPSQFVNVHLTVDTLHNQTVIPMAAVQRGADGTFVFVVTPDMTVTQRDVTLDIQDGDKVAVTKGIQPGDTVVIDGSDRLRDGAEVQIPNPSGKITAPSAGTSSARNLRGGRRGASPEAIAAMQKACADDEKKLCASEGAPGTPQARRCLAQHRDDVSSGCSAAMQAMRGNRRPGQGGGFGGRGGGGGFP
jgi:multidrug efflux system membrane fusion protein